MMDLNKAFQEASKRLQEGQRLDDILASYPEFADELRPLLLTIRLLPKARVQAGEVQAMRSRLDAQFESRLVDFTINRKPTRRPLLALVASIALVFGLLWFFLPRGEGENASEIDLTQSTLEPSKTPTVSPTIVTSTSSPSPTLSPTIATSTSSPSPTLSPTVATITPNPDSESTCTPRRDWESYIVQTGDTLSEIAFNTGISTAELQEANCLPSPRTIVIGQRIYVPRLWEENDDALDDNEGDDDAEDNEGGNNNDDSDDTVGDDTDDDDDDDDDDTEDDDTDDD